MSRVTWGCLLMSYFILIVLNGLLIHDFLTACPGPEYEQIVN